MTTATAPDTREAWHAARRTGIGSSDAAAVVLGVDDFGKTQADIYDRKLGLVTDELDTPDTRRGTALEPVAAQLYSEQTGRQLRRQSMRRHRDLEFMIANVDRQIVSDPKGTSTAEFKVPRWRGFARVKSSGMSDNQQLQVRHQMEVYDYDWAAFCVFHADSWSLIHFDLERDADIARGIIEAEKAFWRSVERRERPTQAPFELPKMPEVTGEIVTREDPEWADAIADLIEAKEIKETALSLEDHAKQAIRELMGGHGTHEGAGVRVHWKPQAGRIGYAAAWKALAKANPLDRIEVVLVLERLREAGTLSREGYIDLVDALPDCSIDLAALETRGKPSEFFRTYMTTRRLGEE